MQQQPWNRSIIPSPSQKFDILGLLIQYIHKYLKIGVQFVATYEYIMYKAIHISMQWVMEPGFRYEIYFNQLEKFEAAKAA